ncbi:MAG TPA: VWA domain-containing protein [Vicinamibacterales bacterium]|nr:VWA domain-containing protein [Vicinamibacterales bacterium]
MTRALAVFLALVATAAVRPERTSAAPQAPAPPGSAQTDQKTNGGTVPKFRAGTDLLTVDVSVLDGRGRPVEGLKPVDFTVRINGQTRQVAVAELVKADVESSSAKPGVSTAPPGAPVVGPAAGRRIVIAVDQQYIPPGELTPLLKSAAAFVDRLTSRDQAAFVAFPEPGPRVDFTNDKARLRQAMQGLIGQPKQGRTGQFDIGLAEALTVSDNERLLTNENQLEPGGDPPVVADIMARNCETSDDMRACRRRVLAESVQIAQEARLDARISVRTLESILQGLVPVQGTKSVILISASLLNDDRSELDTLTRLASAARVSLNVIIVDKKRENINISSQNHGQAPTEQADRRLISEGLEQLAAQAGGGVYRLAGSGEGILDRIAQELSASYVLGVESRPEDQTSDFRNVSVAVRSQGAKVRVSQAFLHAAASPPAGVLASRAPLGLAVPTPRVVRPVEDVLRSALSAPATLTDLPVQVATFSQWDPKSSKVRISMTAKVGEPGIQPGDYAVGYVVTDRENRTVASWSEKQTPGAPSSGLVAPLLLEPGTYSLRFGIVDEGEQKGTVIRELDVRRSIAADAVATSDLLVGSPPPRGEAPRFSVDPHVPIGPVAAYLELYSAMPADLDFTFVDFEIARDAGSPALARETADMVDGPLPSWRVATASIDASKLAPGPYIARARILRDDKTVGVITRDFVLDSREPATIASPAK